MTVKEHLAILKQGVVVWNNWRVENPHIRPNLNGADLNGADLSGSDLREAYLRKAKLRGADLTEADLRAADLREANLIGADLRVADLREADLTGVDLTGAELRETDLRETTIKQTKIGYTMLIDQDLSSFVNAHVIHNAQSFIDHNSIARSLHCANLLPFLVAAGMPHIVATYTIEAIRSLDPNGLFNLMHSTFISYGGPDETFAIKLQETLQSNGVTTFLFKKDAVPGQAIGDVVRGQVREKDRIVVICSESSLDRPGVLNEMELTLRREAREGGHTLLVPIAIDRYVHDGWDPENENLKEAILERVIADFEDADTDQTKFDQGIERLLQALKVSQ